MMFSSKILTTVQYFVGFQMTNKSDFFDKIKNSLNRASETIKIRENIASDIEEIASSISQITEGALAVKFIAPDEKLMKTGYESSEKVVVVIKPSSFLSNGINLFGFGINKETGYPVLIQTKYEDFYALDKHELFDVISDIIDRESINIMDILNQNSNDIPF